jgi:UPF0755 protein
VDRRGNPIDSAPPVSRRDRQTATRAERQNGGRNGGRRPRRGLRVFLVLMLLLSPFLIGAVWFGYQLRPGSNGPAVSVKVTKDMDTGAVADALVKAGVIDSAMGFKIWATVNGANSFDAGTYSLHKGEGIRGALSTLQEGITVAAKPDVKLLLPPGLTLAQIAQRVGQIPGHTADAFLAAVNGGTIKSKYQPPGTTSLEGLLFPDTYFVGAKESEDSIARRLVARFDQIGDKLGLANAQGLTPYQTIVSASLIQTEAKLAEDAPLISAVIRNRIKDNMPLQVDSTLCFAKGGCPPSPTDADKAIDSPYNTYKISGLPPTPIASVTEASLTAAMNPADVPYKYYVVSDANGKHAFATTLDEHNRNVAAARAKGLL